LCFKDLPTVYNKNVFLHVWVNASEMRQKLSVQATVECCTRSVTEALHCTALHTCTCTVTHSAPDHSPADSRSPDQLTTLLHHAQQRMLRHAAVMSYLYRTYLTKQYRHFLLNYSSDQLLPPRVLEDNFNRVIHGTGFLRVGCPSCLLWHPSNSSKLESTVCNSRY